jgi:hypothetical protein
MIQRGSVAVAALQGIAGSIAGASRVATAFTSPGLSAQSIGGAQSAIPTPPPVLFFGVDRRWGTDDGAAQPHWAAAVAAPARLRVPGTIAIKAGAMRRNRAGECSVGSNPRWKRARLPPAPHQPRRIIQQYHYGGDPSGPIMKSKPPDFFQAQGACHVKIAASPLRSYRHQSIKRTSHRLCCHRGPPSRVAWH